MCVSASGRLPGIPKGITQAELTTNLTAAEFSGGGQQRQGGPQAEPSALRPALTPAPNPHTLLAKQLGRRDGRWHVSI